MAAANPKEHRPSAYEIIFSCSICQATAFEIYARQAEPEGLHNGQADQQGTITKLWLTECAHLTCAEHLEGGGVPFHPENEPPKAPCPRCVLDRDDSRPRRLFGIRGWGAGQHDKAIPDIWFQTPPVDFKKAQGSNMEALRFQYLSLVSFGSRLLLRHRSLEKKYSEGKKAFLETKAANEDLQALVQAMTNDMEAYKKREDSYKEWEKRQPEVKLYLTQFARMKKENDNLKIQLVKLGFDVPDTNYRNEPPHFESDGHYDSSSSRTLSCLNSQDVHNGQVLGGSTPTSGKRKFDEYRNPPITSDPEGFRRSGRSSRELMPPPSMPFRTPHKASALEKTPEPASVFQNGHAYIRQGQTGTCDPKEDLWLRSREQQPFINIHDAPEEVCGQQYGEDCEMSGALPAPPSSIIPVDMDETRPELFRLARADSHLQPSSSGSQYPIEGFQFMSPTALRGKNSHRQQKGHQTYSQEQQMALITSLQLHRPNLNGNGARVFSRRPNGSQMLGNTAPEPYQRELVHHFRQLTEPSEVRGYGDGTTMPKNIIDPRTPVTSRSRETHNAYEQNSSHFFPTRGFFVPADMTGRRVNETPIWRSPAYQTTHTQFSEGPAHLPVISAPQNLGRFTPVPKNGNSPVARWSIPHSQHHVQRQRHNPTPLPSAMPSSPYFRPGGASGLDQNLRGYRSSESYRGMMWSKRGVKKL